MVIIDGRESGISLNKCANLEEVLDKIVADEALEHRVVTEVLLDDESFSELYPHQAEDIEADSFSRLEVRTISLQEMAQGIIAELPKVVNIMGAGSRHTAALMRQDALAEGVEGLQDVIDLSRDLLQMIHVLRTQFACGQDDALDALSRELGALLEEVAEVMGNEDWILVADLLEYEYLPACEGWRAIIDNIAAGIAAAGRE